MSTTWYFVSFAQAASSYIEYKYILLLELLIKGMLWDFLHDI